ncbi:MAG: energy transducer TonB [Candidatus Methylacidiphilales bacterium]
MKHLEPANLESSTFPWLVSLVLHAGMLAWVFHTDSFHALEFTPSVAQTGIESEPVRLHLHVTSSLPPPAEPPPVQVQNPGKVTPTARAAPRSRPTNPISAPSQPSAEVLSPRPSPHNLPPVYPETARRRGQEGIVWLEVHINHLGTVEAVRIQKSSGHPLLDTAAQQAVQRWKFSAPKKHQTLFHSDARTLIIPIHFRLDPGIHS